MLGLIDVMHIPFLQMCKQSGTSKGKLLFLNAKLKQLERYHNSCPSFIHISAGVNEKHGTFSP
jgi:hypothetical protein